MAEDLSPSERRDRVALHDLHVEFRSGGQRVQAVNGVDLRVGEGEVVALIGESGSGKSVTLRACMRLHPEASTRYTGRLEVAGHDVLKLTSVSYTHLRAHET